MGILKPTDMFRNKGSAFVSNSVEISAVCRSERAIGLGSWN